MLTKPLPLYVFAKIAVGFPFVIEASWKALRKEFFFFIEKATFINMI